jgi:histidine triad (HIT) family protein
MKKDTGKKGAGKKDADPVLAALKQASKGLQFPSESDAPLEPVLWKDRGELTHERLLELAGMLPGTPVEERTLADVMRTVPKEDKSRFEALVKVLNEQLSGVKVYVVGDEPEKPVYIVGKTSDGKWAGLKTSAVET